MIDQTPKNGISVVVPVFNEQDTISELITRLAKTLKNYQFEVIIVDDHSTDNTIKIAQKLSARHPIKIISKDGQRGKSQSLLQGFAHAQYTAIAMIDGDLQYPPETLTAMVEKAHQSHADIIVAERQPVTASKVRTFISKTYRKIFVKGLFSITVDAQSGLKLFKREILSRIDMEPSPWTFDLSFLQQAQDAGYIIDSVPMPFYERKAGKSKINLVTNSFEIGYETIKLRFTKPQVIELLPQELANGEGFHYRGQKFVHHTQLDVSQSAFYRLTIPQIFLLVIVGELIFEAFLLNWHTAIIVLVSIMTVLYLSDLLFNFFLIIQSFSKSPEIKIPKSQIGQHAKREWPLYTIFCPLYKEWEVVDQFVKGISALNYPKDKLQVILLLEENDTETIAKINEFDLPEYIEKIVVPHSLPKTKPKACNYGLKLARGEYMVIFDAEDIPEPDQLKKVVLAFEKARKDIVCIQAKLNFYNPHQNILTRLFTAEYSLWFDLVLTGLQSINAPIPLGGTSNHFRLSDIKRLNGWDSFNVTEDCDLGIRLVKQGYRTAVVDSVTLEEANSNFKNWINQRSRWIKGYMQTYLVHMREPKSFFTRSNYMKFLTFQLVVGGKVISIFLNPAMWLITISYFVFRPIVGPFIESIYPTPVLYMAVFCLVFGNFLYLYYYMIGCAKREQYEIIKYVFLVPIYWLMMSFASWIALYKLILKPFDWSKTQHGLHLKNQKAVTQVNRSLGVPVFETPASLSALPAKT